MAVREDGSAYPSIHEKDCVSCGLCAQVCPALRPMAHAARPRAVLGAKHRDPAIHQSSQSGGVFYELARRVLRQGGAVYGAAFRADWTVRHIEVTAPEELHRLQGSKYVQSDLETVFAQAKNRLREGRQVLFSGTPCQCAGLRAFLREPYEQLTVVDVLCFGTPPQKLWKQFLARQETLHGGRLTAACFREPCGDGTVQRLTIGGAVYRTAAYTELFYSGVYHRPSCRGCPFHAMRRVGDLSLGDYVGVERCRPDFADGNGVSLVLINTARGERLWRQAAECFDWVTAGEGSYLQPALGGEQGNMESVKIL